MNPVPTILMVAPPPADPAEGAMSVMAGAARGEAGAEGRQVIQDGATGDPEG